MNIRLVRHATLIIELDDGRTLLIDPMLGNIGEFRSFLTELTVPPNNTNPTVSLPSSPDFSSILSSKDTAVFVTHTHPDHFDQAAVNELPKDLHFFCQLLDKETLSNIYGFSSVQPVDANLPPYDGIEVFRTDGQHGPHNLERVMNLSGKLR